VVISKIMYHPPGEKPEYIEVFNNTSNPFDIAQWKLTGGVHYEFPDFTNSAPLAGFLRPFERIVLASATPTETRQAYAVPVAVRIFGPWRGKLNNDAERVTLKDKNEITVCSVKYGSRGDWPVAASGAGHALMLRDPNRAVDDAHNWTATPLPDGAPGTAPAPSLTSPIPSPEIEANLGAVLVDFGDVWRYEDSGRNLGTAWQAANFDDRAWSQGPGLLGFDEKPLPKPGIQTQVKFTSQRASYQRTYYFRRSFIYAGGAKPDDKLVIDQIIDDGAVYYLTGREIGRSRMASGPVTFQTFSSSVVPTATEEMSEITLDPGVLVKGTNLLAVEVHQCTDRSTDIVFGMRLRLTPPLPPGLVINEVLAAGTDGFVEFCNTAGQPVNLKDCFLSDTTENLSHYRFPTDLMVAPNGLTAVSLAECSITNASPLRLYLTAADGKTVLNAVTVNFSQDGRALGRRPDGGGTWFRFPAPTRGQPNPTRDLVMPLRLSEVHFKANAVDWVEVVNLQDAPYALDGLFLASKRTFSDKVPLSADGKSAVIPAKGRASWEVNIPVKDGESLVYLVNQANTVLDAGAFVPPKIGDTRQRFPESGKEWYATTNSTRNAPNTPPRPSEVVINEIMHDPPYGAEGTEFVELCNRGTSTVDLSGWRITGGIAFVFPAGSKIGPHGFLVVAANPAKLKSVYGDLPMAGQYEGRLRHGGELIRLVDAADNLANEVEFRAGGDWPELAHGGGSSLELLHPWMDNARGSAWRDSDESGKGAWQGYSCTNSYLELNSMGQVSDYRELHLYLAGQGHLALRKIGLWKSGVNYLDNPTQMSSDGTSASGWLGQGTHWATFMTNGELHLVSDGRGDDKADRVEIDCVRLTRGPAYELRFEARWISGNPRLIAQTWDHTFGGSFLAVLPARLGTPGGPNSVSAKPPYLAGQAAPQVDHLQHSPPVPRSTNTVTISAHVGGMGSPATVLLFHRPDNAAGDAPWASKPMRGDALAGDGIYTAELTEYRTNTQIVQFYVQASAAGSQRVTLPRQGAAWPAMYVVDDRKAGRDTRLERFVISAYDLGSMAAGNTEKYGFRQPRLSNHRYNMTFISNDEEVFYGGSIRVSGSPFTRGTDLGKGKWDLPGDRPFRGRTKFYFDNDGNYHNRVCRYLLYQMGQVTCEAEWVRVILNSSGAYLKDDTEPVTAEFLERNFKNGNHGDLYRIDDEFWFSDDWEHENRDADWRYKGTDDPNRYRAEWQKKTGEIEDNYSALIAMFKAITSNRYTQEEIERMLDADSILCMAAVRGYINDWDSFTMFRGKNGYFYRPPDGRFQFLQWDSDLAFRNVNYPLYGPRVTPWMEQPYNLSRFTNYVGQLMAFSQSPRLAAWFEMQTSANPAFPVKAENYQQFFRQRNQFVPQMMGRNNRVVVPAPQPTPNPLLRLFQRLGE
jgi:hypothetical protein